MSYTYDALGKTLSETSRGFTHSYEYDLAGNRVKSTYGTGRVVHHAYDGVNRLISLTEAGRVSSWEYDIAGRCVALGQGNGLVQRQSYDAHGRLVQRRLFDEGGAGLLMSVGLAYDAAGNVVRQEERWNQSAGGAAVPDSNRTTTMEYDNAYRLTAERVVKHADSSEVITSYQYDAAGNRISKAVSGLGDSTEVTTYTYNALNQLTQHDTNGNLVTYTYDANGNRTSRAKDGSLTHSYYWDWNNRLEEVGVTEGGSTLQHRYSYDYRMRRTTRQEPGIATAVTYSGGVSVAEYSITHVPSGTLDTQPTVEYQRGPDMGGGVGGLLYSLRSGTPKFNLSNGRGDVVAQSDSTGALTWTASYEAYGKRTVEAGSNPDRQRANTKEEDPTGLLNEGFRYRDLETGTWLSRDPAGFVDGPNLYAYVQQNPWSKFDPDGLEWKGIFFGKCLIIGGRGGITTYDATEPDYLDCNFPRYDVAKAKVNALQTRPGEFLKGTAGGYLGNDWGSSTLEGRLGRDVGGNLAEAEAVVALGRSSARMMPGAPGPPAVAVATGGDVSVVGASVAPAAVLPANVLTQTADAQSQATTKGGAAPVEAGQAGETVSSQLTGRTKNTVRIPSASGKKEYRIPDHMDYSQRCLTETKNVDYQYYSSQLKDDKAHVLRGGGAGRVDVIIDQRTTISLQLLREHLNPGSPIKLRSEKLSE